MAQLMQDDTGKQREHKSDALDNCCRVIASGSMGKNDPANQKQEGPMDVDADSSNA